MASNGSTREIWYHPNSAQTFLVHGPYRREFVSVGGSTATQQIAAQINQGAIDKRPGAPGQVTGADAVHFLEGLEAI
jgi:hypothetical protein